MNIKTVIDPVTLSDKYYFVCFGLYIDFNTFWSYSSGLSTEPENEYKFWNFI